MPLTIARLPPHGVVSHSTPTQLRGFQPLRAPCQPGKGWRFTEGRNPLRLYSPCDLLAKHRVLGVCVPLTVTCLGQLFHRRLASTGSYGLGLKGLPVQALEVLAFAVPSFHCHAS